MTQFSDLFGGTTSPAPTDNTGSGTQFSDLFSGPPSAAPAGGNASGGTQFSDLFSGATPGQDTGKIGGTAKAPGPAYKPSGGLLGGIKNALHTAGHVASTAITGAGHVISGLPAVGGEIVKEAAAIPRQAGIDVYDDLTSGSTYRNGQQTGGGLGPTQKEWTGALNQYPVAGTMIRGPQVTGEELAHPSRLAKNYSANPAGAFLNDIGTLSMVLPVVGGVIKGAAVGGEASQAAIRAADAADTISNAGKARLAAAKVGDAVTAVGHAPSLPFRATKGYLAGLAGKMGTDSALLHAEDLSGAAGAAAAPTVSQAPDAIKAAMGAVPKPNIIEPATTKPALEQLLKGAGPVTPGVDPAAFYQKAGLGKQYLDYLAASQDPVVSRLAGQMQAGRMTETLTDALQKAIDSGTLEKSAKAEPIMWTKGGISPAEDVGNAALTAERNTALAANRGRAYTPFKSSLATIGASLNNPAIEMAKNSLVSGMSRLRDVGHDEGKGLLTKEDANAQKASLLQDITKKLQDSPIVTRLSDTDLASLTADAKAADKSLDQYTKDLGFQKLDVATNHLTQDPTAYVTRDVASHLDRYTAAAPEAGAPTAFLKIVNRAAMVSKLALSPTTLINRVGHGVLATAANPNTLETLKTIPRALFGKLTESEKADLATTTMPFHGAVDEVAAKVQATDPRRLAKIADAPASLLAHSPFLQLARKADDATRSAVWLAARKAGASQEEADLILGRAAGYFDRATTASRRLSTVVPFYNWHKQVMFTLEHMAEMHPTAFAQFTHLASGMADYQQQQGIYGSNTRFGGKDVDLSSLNPFSGAVAPPTELAGPIFKAGMPLGFGVLPSGKPPKGPTGDIVGRGLHQMPAALHELSNVLPQIRFASDLRTGGAPRYSNGSLVAPSKKNPATPAGDLHVWTSMLGVPVSDAKTEKATSLSIAASKAAAAKRDAATMKSYNKRLAASGR